MSWLYGYRKRAVEQTRRGGPNGGLYRLHSTWPLLLGGLVFAVFDLSLDLSVSARYALIASFTTPGLIWFFYLMYHEIVGFRRRLAERLNEDSING